MERKGRNRNAKREKYSLPKRENKNINIEKELKFVCLGNFFLKCKHVGEYGLDMF